ncbi:MAG: aquaporin [Ruminococcaceae bacterium]|nr:aquaporin [Oscillospiraceae bacterium]
MKKYIAEFIGTFVLVLLGCGTACAVGCNAAEGSGYLLTALAFGLVIVAMAYSIGNVSGCHINPAVSIAMLVSKKMGIKDFFGYIVAQFAGATAGAALLAWFFGVDSGLGANNLLWNDGDLLMGLAIEVLLTFIFVLAILGVTSKIENGAVAGIVIGLTLALVHIMGITFTGTSVNPARSFGPALLAGGEALSNLWVFLVAPLVGGVLAALVYGFLSSDKPVSIKLPKCKKAKKDEDDEDEEIEVVAVEAAPEIVEIPAE